MTDIACVSRECPGSRTHRLHRLTSATRWPKREPVADDSQGVPLSTMQELAQYWGERSTTGAQRSEAELAATVRDRDRWD
jgi:hypothetical protein